VRASTVSSQQNLADFGDHRADKHADAYAKVLQSLPRSYFSMACRWLAAVSSIKLLFTLGLNPFSSSARSENDRCLDSAKDDD
jgi:hypothetical protein